MHDEATGEDGCRTEGDDGVRSIPRILVLVLSFDGEPWRTIEEDGQRATWAGSAALPPGVDVVWYRGSRVAIDVWATLACRGLRRLPACRGVGDRLLLRVITRSTRRRRTTRQGDHVHVGTPDVMSATAPKLHEALEWALEDSPFDVVWRTNSSTFVDLPTLLSIIDRLEGETTYAGFVGHATADDGTDVRFASGTGILMSRDVVESLVASRMLHTTQMDDVAVGVACARLGIALRPLRRLDVGSSVAADALDRRDLEDIAFVRCHTRSADRGTVESAIMAALERAYRSARGT